MTKASQEYLKNAVLTASCEQLQLMLIDGAIRFSTRAREAIAARQVEPAFNALERAQRIVVELINGMKRDANPSLVDQMASLYNFIYRRLVDACIQRETGPVDDALRILRHQRETWVLLIEKIQRELAGPPATAPAASAPATPDSHASDRHASGSLASANQPPGRPALGSHASEIPSTLSLQG